MLGQLAFCTVENYLTEVLELLVIRAKKNHLLAKHTNQSMSWKVSFCSDRAHGISFVHFVLQNSIQPASSKTSLTIAAIYDEKEDIKKNQEILRNIIETLEKLHLKHTLELEFPSLTEIIIKELKSLHDTAENPKCIERQIKAVKQLELKKLPAPKTALKFQKPIIFEIPQTKRCQSWTVEELRYKMKRDVVIGPKRAQNEQLIEILENEIQDLENLNPSDHLTPCP